MTSAQYEALHLCYGRMQDLTLEELLATDDLPANARVVITEIVARRDHQADAEELPMTTYRLDFDALTVIAIDEHGREHDLNAEGEPCRDFVDLRKFIAELERQSLQLPATAMLRSCRWGQGVGTKDFVADELRAS